MRTRFRPGCFPVSVAAWAVLFYFILLRIPRREGVGLPYAHPDLVDLIPFAIFLLGTAVLYIITVVVPHIWRWWGEYDPRRTDTSDHAGRDRDES